MAHVIELQSNYFHMRNQLTIVTSTKKTPALNEAGMFREMKSTFIGVPKRLTSNLGCSGSGVGDEEHGPAEGGRITAEEMHQIGEVIVVVVQ